MNKKQIRRRKAVGARALFVGGVLPACVVLLAGCGIARRESNLAPGQLPRIVVIAGAPDENWEPARRGALDAGKAMGAAIEWHAPSATSPTGETPLAQQKKWMKEAVAANANGIALAPLDATELVPAINKAGRSFVPTLTFDTSVYTTEKLTAIQSDDRAGGALAARLAAKVAGATGQVAILPANDDSGGTQIAESFEATLESEFPGIRISRPASAATLSAPAPGVLFAPDEAASHAALKAALPRTKLIATGCSEELIRGLQNGSVHALLAPDRYAMAFQSVHAIMEYRTFHPPPHEIAVAPVLATKDTLKEKKIRRALTLETRDVPSAHPAKATS